MKKYFLLLIAIFSLFCFSNNIQALEIADKPTDTLIYDPYNYISFETEDKINKLNEELDLSEEHFQIGVYIIESLENTSIEEFALNISRKWGIGDSKTNNGALLVIAINDRKFRIETSDNVAIKITDSIANEILNNSKRFFREENFDDGVYSIIENMSSYYSKGTITNYYDNSDNEEGVFPLFVILFWLFIFWIIGFIIDLFIKRVPFYSILRHFFWDYLPRTLMTIIKIIILLSDSNDYSNGSSSNRSSGSGRSSGGGGFSGGGSSGSW